ncbi:MAG: hypothetical protein EA376_05855 [Phycisphaeraceae bacterium]|nr:MAG: hypothetical protein EA376_05855 [Phycisphaeraceae bacterium]
MFQHVMVIGRCLVIATLLCGVACAQQIPVLESGQAIVNTTVQQGKIEMRDASTGAPILMQRDRKLHVANPEHNTITPTIERRPQPTGFDLVYSYHNSSSTPKALGAVEVGVLTLGQQITYQDFRFDGKPAVGDTRQPRAYSAWTYPNRWYSPVFVMRNDDIAVGVSLQYPMLEYKHQVRTEMWSPGGGSSVGEGGRGWAVQFRFDNFGNENPGSRIRDESFLAPGERRTYVVSVRVTRNPEEWVRTLLPYRDYFRSLYGGVRYSRDPRPVLGVTVAGAWRASADNKFGFAGPNRFRPDLHGWKPWVDNIFNEIQNGPERLMLWAPSGVYHENRENNFPFQFTSNWMTSASEGAMLRNAPQQLRRFSQAGVELGLWWGRSSEYMDQWDTPHAERIEMDNSEHMDAVLRELDLAVQAGATVIGLDAVFKSALWEVYERIEMMQERHPHVRFVTEGRSADLFHTLAPTWFDLYVTARFDVDPADARQLTTPFYLADFLLPGHETWVGVMHTRLENALGREPTNQELVNDVENMLDMGYVPVLWRRSIFDPSWRAAKSWLNTVPNNLLGMAGEGHQMAHITPDQQQLPQPTARTTRRAGPAVRQGGTVGQSGVEMQIVELRPGRLIMIPSNGRIMKNFTPATERATHPGEPTPAGSESRENRPAPAKPAAKPTKDDAPSSTTTVAPAPR